MKINIFCLLLSCVTSLTLAEYPRFKYRGPPPISKPRPIPQYTKKWQQFPQRPPVRSRPIPVHMPTQHKIPMGVASTVNRPIAVPVRTFWKNTQTTYRTPLSEKPYLPSIPISPKKTFISSPTIISQEYDFHVQNNNISTPIKTIKQIGEKGPIHTIPAPNLSPADKPPVIEEIKPIRQYPEKNSYVQVQKSHQYQVTEIPEPKVYNSNQPYQTQNFDLSQKLQQTKILLNDQLTASQLNPNELYQFLNTYHQQPQVVEAFAVPLLQQIPNYNTLAIQKSHFIHPQQNLIEPEPVASDKISIQPEYHSFNYEEQNQIQSRKDVKKKELSSLVNSGYNLEPRSEAPQSSVLSILSRNNPIDSVSQSEYVQNYFDTRNDNANNVEPDAKPSQDVTEKNKPEPSGFYVSLPNKEAADALASLQAAGKINSNLMQISKKVHDKLPLSIYVPDDSEKSQSQESGRNEFQNVKQYSVEEELDQNYEDYSQEDMMSDESDDSFGHRVEPKTN